MPDLPIVMVVDDALVNRRLITAQLKGSNFAVAEFSDGKSALEYLRANYPKVCLLLLDISMPDISGINVCHIIRTEMEPAEKRLPIIAYTAHAMTHERPQFISAGFDDFLLKPFVKEQLLSLLDRYANQSETA